MLNKDHSIIESGAEKNDSPTTARALEDIREMTEKNLAISEDIRKTAHYIKRYVIISQTIGFLKLALIVTPIILGILYLPSIMKDITPMFNQAVGVYQELLGIKKQVDQAGGQIDLNKIDVNSLPPEMKKLLK